MKPARRSGGLLWKEKFESRLTAPPAAGSDGGVYLPCLDKHIYAMRTVESQVDGLSPEGSGDEESKAAKKGTVEIGNREVIIDGIRLERK